MALFLLGPWFSQSFWDDVEYEIETAAADDFEEFEAAEDLSIQPRPGFEADLRERLREYIETRYTRGEG